jgi:hypothetical protein
MAMISADQEGHRDAGEFFRSLGPQHIDTSIRQTIEFCWMMMPEATRNADELERQIRRIVDRALKDFREDQAAFSGPFQE